MLALEIFFQIITSLGHKSYFEICHFNESHSLTVSPNALYYNRFMTLFAIEDYRNWPTFAKFLCRKTLNYKGFEARVKSATAYFAR